MIAKSALLSHDERHRALCKAGRTGHRPARPTLCRQIARLLLVRRRDLNIAPVQVHGALAYSLYQ